jgi:hypothetical protein
MTGADMQRPGTECPHCGKVTNAATGLNGGRVQPMDGDFIICLHCTKPSVYVHGAAARRTLSADEQKYLQGVLAENRH